jgi:hypothetical protein
MLKTFLQLSENNIGGNSHHTPEDFDEEVNKKGNTKKA